MSILGFILIVVLIGLALYLIERFIPMDDKVKTFLRIAVIILLVIWLLDLLGVLPIGSMNAPMPRTR